jgi:hypothetical protein
MLAFLSMPCNKGISAASFWPQVAAWVLDMLCNFYLMKNHKIAKNSTTTKGIGKISTDLESLEFFNVCLTKFKNNQILLIKLTTDFY